ncbi:hypothetical protein PQG02_35045 (plasmid) [Nostoc sp. UHCC 0926]|nr:hypothetical protein PQG02_35045 [Nostoc sp. UHCC 0926]
MKSFLILKKVELEILSDFLALVIERKKQPDNSDHVEKLTIDLTP